MARRELKGLQHLLLQQVSPEPLAELLQNYIHQKDIKEDAVSEDDVEDLLDVVIEAAEELPPPPAHLTDSARARCPLCKGKPEQRQYYALKHGGMTFPLEMEAERAGYTIPIGLERHLEGYGNMRQCEIMKIIDAMHAPKQLYRATRPVVRRQRPEPKVVNQRPPALQGVGISYARPRWFGEDWGADAIHPDDHMDTPVGIPCMYCTQPIALGDQGLILTLFTHMDVNRKTIGSMPVTYHLTCWSAMVALTEKVGLTALGDALMVGHRGEVTSG
jgi:hypothetical protein